MNTTSNADAGENVLWPGATPYFDASIAPKSLRASGVAPGHSVCALQANFPPIPRPQCRRSLSEQIEGAHMQNPESNRGERIMPLLKPPEPVIAQRRYYVRIEEPLALTMERYAEFLGTDNLDHVVSQALQFIFKRDSQFKSWLEQHPKPVKRRPAPRAPPRREVHCDSTCARLQRPRRLRSRLCHRNHSLLSLAISGRVRPSPLRASLTDSCDIQDISPC